MRVTTTAIFLMLLLPLSCSVRSLDDPGAIVPRTVEQDDTLPAYELTDGTRLHLETYGTSDGSNVLIVLHGGPGGDYASYLNLRELADDYFIVFWDQRGSGLSARVPESTISVAKYLSDLNELADHFSPGQPFSIIGHSWGGAFATAYVQAYPQRVRRLALLEPMALNARAAKNMGTTGIDLTDEAMNRFLEGMDHLLPDTAARADYLMLLTTLLDSDDDFAAPEERKRLPFWRSGFHAWHAIADELGFILGDYAYDFTEGLLEDYPGKVLLLAGTASRRIGVDFQVQNHLDLFADLEFVEVEGAGHYMIEFNSGQVIPVLRTYLDEAARKSSVKDGGADR